MSGCIPLFSALWLGATSSRLLVLFSHRPSLLFSSLLAVCHSHATSSNPHRDRKMGVNVNSVSARPRKTAFRRYIKGEQFLFLFFSSFSLSLAPTAISILENFLSLSQRGRFRYTVLFNIPCLFSCHLSSALQTSFTRAYVRIRPQNPFDRFKRTSRVRVGETWICTVYIRAPTFRYNNFV